MLAALAIAVLVSVIVVERHTLAESLHVLAHLNWAWFLLALASEAISLSSFGLSRRQLLRVSGRPPSFGTVMAITYAANALSISVPFAGAELAMVFSYRQFRRHGVDAATTGWMLAVSAIFSTSALALLLAIGALAGSASLASAAGFLGAFVFVVPGVAVLLALRFENIRRLLHQVIAWLVGLSRSVLGVPAHGVDGLDEFLDRVASLRLPWPRYAEVFGLAVLNWAADCGALACAIKATGQSVPWHSLLLVYGAGRRGRQHRNYPGGIRPRRAGSDRGADRRRAAPVAGAGRRAGLPPGQLLADPHRRVDLDGRARPPPDRTGPVAPAESPRTPPARTV